MGDNPVSIIPSGIDAREVEAFYCNILSSVQTMFHCIR